MNKDYLGNYCHQTGNVFVKLYFPLQLVTCNTLSYSSQLFMGTQYSLHDVFGSVYGLSFDFHQQWVTVVCFILPLPIETVPAELHSKRNFRTNSTAPATDGNKSLHSPVLVRKGFEHAPQLLRHAGIAVHQGKRWKQDLISNAQQTAEQCLLG